MKSFDNMKFKSNSIAFGEFEFPDVMTQDVNIPVERDASGVPVAWRLYKLGENDITKNGVNFVWEFTNEMFDRIMSYFNEKGIKVPLDSRHFLFRLAEKYQVSENDIIKLLPDGTGTFGFGDLEKRPDGLWIVRVEYVPLARELMIQGIWRYFSPVIRGLLDGRLRVTSVTLENEPAFNNLDAIAASSECGIGVSPVTLDEIQGNLDALAASAYIKIKTNQKEKEEMKKLLPILAGLLAVDSIALGADGNLPEGIAEKINNLKTEVTGLRDGKAKITAFIGSVRDALALGADADLNAVEGRVLGIVEKAKTADGLKLRVDALELSAETEKLDKLKAKGKADGKLTEAILASEWLKKQDSVALSAFLDAAPVVIPSGSLKTESLGNSDAIALSASDEQICNELEIDKVKFLAAKKEQAEAKKAK